MNVADDSDWSTGIKLALLQAGDKAGQWTVNFISLDDSTATSARPTTTSTHRSGRTPDRAATDPKAVLLVGPFNSGCAKVDDSDHERGRSRPGQSREHVLGADDKRPGNPAGEPQKYYPTGKRTYLRIVPRDTIQGQAGLMAMKQAGCTRVAVADDKTAVRRRARYADPAARGKSDGITVTGDHRASTRRRRTSVRTRRRVKSQGATASTPRSTRPGRWSWSRTSTPRSRPPRSSAATASARGGRRTRRRAGSPRASRRCSSARWRRRG